MTNTSEVYSRYPELCLYKEPRTVLLVIILASKCPVFPSAREGAHHCGAPVRTFAGPRSLVFSLNPI